MYFYKYNMYTINIKLSKWGCAFPHRKEFETKKEATEWAEDMLRRGWILHYEFCI